MVSIVTPSFEQGRYLDSTITSVLSQQYQPLEYVVIDGGSRDGTLDVLRQYAGHGLQYVSEPDRGQSDAVNKGVRMTKGAIVAWLNSDDCYLPGAIEAAVNAFEAHPEAVVVYGDFIKIDGNNSVIALRRRPSFNENVCAFSFITLPQPATFIRRTAFEAAGGLPESLHFAMDFSLWLSLAKLGKFVHIRRYLAAFRIHEASKSVKSRNRQREEVALIRRQRYPNVGTVGMFLRQSYYWAKAAYLCGSELCFPSWLGLETEEPCYAELLRRRTGIGRLWSPTES